MKTLPDYLKPDLDIVFVGINPSQYSVHVGHYYAKPGNRFWKAANQSGLFDKSLGPKDDHRVLEFGIGLTDVVKRPTRKANDLRAADYQQWVPVFKANIERFKPRIVCFQGIVGYRNYLRHGEGMSARLKAGPQDCRLGFSEVFLIPSSSAANRRFCSDEELGNWFKKLKSFRDALIKH